MTPVVSCPAGGATLAHSGAPPHGRHVSAGSSSRYRSSPDPDRDRRGAAAALAVRPAGPDPLLIRIAIAVALPLVAAGTILGTFAGYEIVVAAGWIALAVSGLLFIRPVVGIAAMTVLFLL